MILDHTTMAPLLKFCIVLVVLCIVLLISGFVSLYREHQSLTDRSDHATVVLVSETPR